MLLPVLPVEAAHVPSEPSIYCIRMPIAVPSPFTGAVRPSDFHGSFILKLPSLNSYVKPEKVALPSPSPPVSKVLLPVRLM